MVIGAVVVCASWALLVLGGLREDVRLAIAGGVLAAVGILAGFFLKTVRMLARSRSGNRRLRSRIVDGDIEQVRRLLAESPELVCTPDAHGSTPLHHAAFGGHVEICELLLTGKANVNAREPLMGLTALHVAACRGYGPLTASLHLDSGGGRRRAPAANARTVCELLLDHGAKPNTQAGFGRTSLHLAALAGQEELIEVLLARGADATATDGLGFTALHYAAYTDGAAGAEKMLVAGADPDARAEMGYTPLHTASERGARRVAEVLLERGADVNALTRHGRTPMALARQRGDVKIAGLLARHGGKEAVDSDAQDE